MTRSIIAKSVTISLGLSLLSACGKIDHEVKGSTDVNINLNIDFSKLEEYFRPLCEEENPSASDEELQVCVNRKVGEFIDVLTAGS